MMSQSPDEPITDAEVVEDPADQAALALPTAPIAEPVMDYTEGGLPTFDYVRDKIEGRVATSIGAAELAEGMQSGPSPDEQFEAREQAGRDRLEQIRRSMRKE
jgi:hypothetical protein